MKRLKEINNLYNYVDYVEFYEEFTKSKVYNFVDSKLDDIITNNYKGLGVRLLKDDTVFYLATNKKYDFNDLKSFFYTKTEKKQLIFKDIKTYEDKIEVKFTDISNIEKKNFFIMIDKIIREYSNLIKQVSIKLSETTREIKILNSKSDNIKYLKYFTRLVITVIAEEKNKMVEHSMTFSNKGGLELLSNEDFPSKALEIAKTVIEKLSAKKIIGGKMPVILNNGFGAVIFHEACGHGLEAEALKNNLTVFKDDLGKKIATDKVTLIDDPTIENYYGSNLIDDEGNLTKEVKLIEKGILKSYLVDNFNGKKLSIESTSSSRRENYLYKPTSRMSNTYLLSGNDKIEDMIKSINYGIYAKEMGGGSVDPSTGNFNFYITLPYLIENGEIKDLLEPMTLVGNSKEILQNVEMVSDDLKLEAGICGASSGNIPVTIGQPTIKIKEILVGGSDEQ
jgi:peptidase U62 modulator of DNA gyrase